MREKASFGFGVLTGDRLFPENAHGTIRHDA